jgi:hypothetical protein
MKIQSVVVLSLAIAATPAFAESYSKKDAEKYIEDAEAAWTHAAVTGDASVAKRILAEDYFGVFPDGSVVNKAEALEAFSEPSPFLDDRLETVHVRFFGDTAVAQGSETWTMRPERRRGKPKSGQYIWLDVWVLRHGKWQIVNSEDQDQPLNRRGPP